MKKYQFDVDLINPPTGCSVYSKEKGKKKKIYLVIIEYWPKRRKKARERERETERERKKDSLTEEASDGGKSEFHLH